MTAERPGAELWAVDAVADGVAVLVLVDETDELVISEVTVELLGTRAVAGALLKVPLGDVGEPVWEQAVRVEEPGDEDGGPAES